MRGHPLLALCLLPSLAAAPAPWCSPAALAATHGGQTLYVACATGNRVEAFDTVARKIVRTFRMPGPATGVTLSSGETRLFVTVAAPVSTIHSIDLKTGAERSVAGGHAAEGPALSPDGKLLYVSNRFTGDISVVDTEQWKETGRIRVIREPASVVPAAGGKLLFAINSLPAGRADIEYVAAEISLVEADTGRITGRIVLPNGSTELRGAALSPDGAWIAVTHLLSRYYLPTTQLERGWMETNALTLIDVARRQILATVLLDEIDQGAANPWSVAWTAGGKLVVTHAGTHEVSVIDANGLIGKCGAGGPGRRAGAALQSRTTEDLSFLVGLRRRIKLAGKGPRALAVAGERAWVAGYFSDTIEEIGLANPAPVVVARLSDAPMTSVRRGEMHFNDATLCFQNWQSCASCHSPDARVDGLNWDLLNDGIGNPKNVKSLLLAHRTPPSMSHGLRENAEAAVRAGLQYILFAQRPEEEAHAIDDFLKSLKPLVSPHLVNGKLSPAAERGRKLFNDAKVGCAACHPAGLYTNLKTYDVGTRCKTDTSGRFDTPTLVELWRTAPYLHDGSAATLRDVLTVANPKDRHGHTSHLSAAQIDDLVEYLLSL